MRLNSWLDLTAQTLNKSSFYRVGFTLGRAIHLL